MTERTMVRLLIAVGILLTLYLGSKAIKATGNMAEKMERRDDYSEIRRIMKQ